MDSRICLPNNSNNEMTCKFVVNNFSLLEGDKPIDSLDTIFMPNYAEFELMLYPNKANLRGFKNSSIIYIVNYDIQTSDKVSFNCAISILNEHEEKCYTKESQLVINDRKIESGWSCIISRDYLMDPANGLLPNDTLTIVCEMSVIDQPEPNPKPKSALELFQQKHQPIANDLESLFDGRKMYSDVVLVSALFPKKATC